MNFERNEAKFFYLICERIKLNTAHKLFVDVSPNRSIKFTLHKISEMKGNGGSK